MNIQIFQNLLFRNFGTCKCAENESVKILQVHNLLSGEIVIKASAGDEHWEPLKLPDGSELIIKSTDKIFQFQLPTGNYVIKAEGTGVNDDVVVRLS